MCPKREGERLLGYMSIGLMGSFMRWFVLLLLLVSIGFAADGDCPDGCECLSEAGFNDKYDKDSTQSDLCGGEPVECGFSTMYKTAKFCFTIPPEFIGSGDVGKGPNDPGDHDWEYDPNSTDIWNEMMQIKVTAGSVEDIKLTSLKLSAFGTGDDSTGIARIEVYLDMLGDGSVDPTDPVIGTAEPPYMQDNGTKRMGVNLKIKSGSTKYLLIVYVMSANAQDGDTYGFTAESLKARGETSGVIFDLSGFPRTSGLKTVIRPPVPLCTGNLTLALNQSDAAPGAPITAGAVGPSTCARVIEVSAEPCDFSDAPATLCSCTPAAPGSGCSCSFLAPEAGEHLIYACSDFDGDMAEDSGESASAKLLVEEQETDRDGCLSDVGCADDESCEEGECVVLSGSCGYAANHSWITHECGDGCLACPEPEVCESNECVLYLIEAPAAVTLGDSVVLSVLRDGGPAHNISLSVMGPEGEEDVLPAGLAGETTFTPNLEGRYVIAVIKGKEMVASKELDVSRGDSVADLISKLTYLFTQNPLLWALIVVFIILAASGLSYWRHRIAKREESQEGEIPEE
jgi:hypothetical protein